MEEIKIKRKTKGSILRMPEWSDLPLSAMLFLVARSSIIGTYAPGFSFFAAVCDARAAYIYLPVLLLGSLSAGADPIKYFLAALLFWLISELRLRRAHRITNALYCGGLIFLCGFIQAAMSPSPLPAILLLLIEGIFSGVLYYAFSNTRIILSAIQTPGQITREEIVSVILLFCAAISGFSGITLPLGINIAVILGIYAILFVITHLSLPRAVCFAAAVGFSSAAVSGDSVVMTGIMVISSIFAALLKQYGKYAVVTGFLAGAAVSLLYLAEDYSLPLSPVPLLFSAAMFILTPNFIHKKINSLFLNTLSDPTNTDIKIKSYIARELKGVSAAFKRLSARLLATSEATAYNSAAASASLFENVTERICNNCPAFNDCWRKNLNETCRQMFMIIDIMDTSGYCDMTNIPIVFSQKCRQPESFLSEFNHVYEMRKQCTLWQTEASAGRDLIAHQYAEISSVIADISSEVELGFHFIRDAEDTILHALLSEKFSPSDVRVIEGARHKPEVYITIASKIGRENLKKLVSSAMDFPMMLIDDYPEGYHLIPDNLYYPEISVKQKTKEGQAVCGDTALHFDAPGNRYCVILCDGMGSGDEAFAESHMTAELLKEFISAGVRTETAIRIVNSSFALKTHREGFSTVDILELDLISGGIELYKVGAAQSYLKIRDRFETVHAKTLPLGIIDDITINHTRHEFKGGDMAVLVSDGVGEADFGAIRGEWVKKAMSEPLSAGEISDSIIDDALKKTFPSPSDDMTAVVVKLCRY